MTARTPAGTPLPAARITILDILRALALLGIVIVHTHDHFNLYLPMPPAEGWQAAANSAADWAYEHLFVSKSFLLFSFLFGLSFFIQLDRREQQGIDFRKRFMWRLTLLFLLGLAHTLFYDGDILTLFQIQGLTISFHNIVFKMKSRRYKSILNPNKHLRPDAYNRRTSVGSAPAAHAPRTTGATPPIERNLSPRYRKSR